MDNQNSQGRRSSFGRVDRFERMSLSDLREKRTLSIKRKLGGLIIGSKGSTIEELKRQTRCEITIPSLSQLNPDSDDTTVTIRGATKQDVDFAVTTIQHIIQNRRHLTCLFRGTPATSGTRLYLDTCNFFSSFFFEDDWSVSAMVERVETLVNAIQRQGCTMVAFIDGARVSDEARDKFKERRLEEVRRGDRSIPQNTSWMVVEALRNQGIEARYSQEMDNDHTLAYYAFHDLASIVSADQDFYRYGVNLQIYSAFNVDNKGRLLLEAGRQYGSRDPLVLPHTPPKYVTFEDDSHMFQRKENLMGSPSPLTKLLGNPNVKVTELRHVIYAAYLDPGSEVNEIIPIWEDEDAVFTETRVVVGPPDENIAMVLDGDPQSIFHKYFPLECNKIECPIEGVSQETWYRHSMGCFSLVLELWCMYRSKLDEKSPSFLDNMLQWETGRALQHSAQ